MSTESNPAFQAAWEAHSSSFPLPPFDSERELFRAGYEAREAEVKLMGDHLAADDDLFRWVQQWMIDNDYECGPEGAQIWEEIEHRKKARAALQPEQTNA